MKHELIRFFCCGCCYLLTTAIDSMQNGPNNFRKRVENYRHYNYIFQNHWNEIKTLHANFLVMQSKINSEGFYFFQTTSYAQDCLECRFRTFVKVKSVVAALQDSLNAYTITRLLVGNLRFNRITKTTLYEKEGTANANQNVKFTSKIMPKLWDDKVVFGPSYISFSFALNPKNHRNQDLHSFLFCFTNFCIAFFEERTFSTIGWRRSKKYSEIIKIETRTISSVKIMWNVKM